MLHPRLTLCDQILAIGFILVILSSALYHNFLTLLVVAGVESARDMRPEQRDPEWSVGRLLRH